MLQMFVGITWFNTCESILFLESAMYKYYYMKSTKVCLFSHKSIIYLEIISSKALKMSRKKSVLLFLKNQHFILCMHLLLFNLSFASNYQRHYHMHTYHDSFTVSASTISSEIFQCHYW